MIAKKGSMATVAKQALILDKLMFTLFKRVFLVDLQENSASNEGYLALIAPRPMGQQKGDSAKRVP